MRAILVGSVGGRNLYYDIDSKDKSKDGIVQKEDGSLIFTGFFSLISKSNDIKKLRKTRFQETIWGGPTSIKKSDWESIFIQKTEDMPDAIIQGSEISEDIKPPKKKRK